MPANLIAECVKLAIQFVGALLIARLAVRWALNRYKSEKTWERRLGAYVDAVTAISEMRLVVGKWFDHAIMRLEISEEYNKIQGDRYKAARRRLDEGVATGLLLLPRESAELLSDLTQSLDDSDHFNTMEDALDHDYGLLNKALGTLIAQGRTVLGVR